MKDKIASFKLFLILIMLLSAIIVPYTLIDLANQKQKAFPNSTEKIVVNNKTFNDTKKYNSIKEQLQNDYYFTKFALMEPYDYKTANTSQTELLASEFVFNYELANDSYFISKKKDSGRYCLNKKSLLMAYSELYAIDEKYNKTKMEDLIKYLDGYYDIVDVSNGKYCFNFNNIISDSEILVGIERLAMIGSTITTDLYVYEYYSDGSSDMNSDKEKLKTYLSQNNFDYVRKIVTNNYNGRVTHKQLQFNINYNGKFFKYKLLKSTLLDY